VRSWSDALDEELLPLLPKPVAVRPAQLFDSDSESSATYDSLTSSSEYSYEYEYEYEYYSDSDSESCPPPLPEEIESELVTEADLAAAEEEVVAAEVAMEAAVAAAEAAVTAAEQAIEALETASSSSDYTYTYEYVYSDLESSESTEFGRLTTSSDETSSSGSYDEIEIIGEGDEAVAMAVEAAVEAAVTDVSESDAADESSSDDTEEDWVAPRSLRQLLSYLDSMPSTMESSARRFLALSALYFNVMALLPDEDYDEVNWSYYFGDWSRLMDPDMGYDQTFILQSVINGLDALTRDMIERHPEEAKRPYFKMYLESLLQQYQILVVLTGNGV
jgi:hypothetical protein